MNRYDISSLDPTRLASRLQGYPVVALPASCGGLIESNLLRAGSRVAKGCLIMNETAQMLVAVAVKLGLFASGVFYAFLALTTYAKEGPNYRLHLELGDPARSVERLLIWMGSKVTTRVGRGFRSILELLYEASANVGTWVVSKSSAQVQARVRSRFL
jgi:hypothetical protein